MSGKRDARFIITVQTNAGTITAWLDLFMRRSGLSREHFDICKTVVCQQLRARGFYNLETSNARFVWEHESGDLDVNYRDCQHPIEWEA